MRFSETKKTGCIESSSMYSHIYMHIYIYMYIQHYITFYFECRWRSFFFFGASNGLHHQIWNANQVPLWTLCFSKTCVNHVWAKTASLCTSLPYLGNWVCHIPSDWTHKLPCWHVPYYRLHPVSPLAVPLDVEVQGASVVAPQLFPSPLQPSQQANNNLHLCGHVLR